MPSRDESPADLVALFGSAMRAFPEMETRKVFSYPCAFINRDMAAGLHGIGLFLRLADEDARDLLGVRGAAPLEPVKGRPVKN